MNERTVHVMESEPGRPRPRRTVTTWLVRAITPLALATALSLVAAACGSDGDSTAPPTGGPSPAPSPSPSPTPTPPPTASCTPSITGLPGTLPSLGGRFPFTVSSGANCSWTAQTDVSWADVGPSSGVGTANVQLNVAENTRVDTRTVTVSIGNQSVRLTQNGTTCVLTISPAIVEVPDQGGRLEIFVTTTAACTWTGTTTQPWIRIATPPSTGSGTLLVDVLPNTGDVRQGTVSIGGALLTITQRRG